MANLPAPTLGCDHDIPNAEQIAFHWRVENPQAADVFMREKMKRAYIRRPIPLPPIEYLPVSRPSNFLPGVIVGAMLTLLWMILYWSLS